MPQFLSPHHHPKQIIPHFNAIVVFIYYTLQLLLNIEFKDRILRPLFSASHKIFGTVNVLIVSPHPHQILESQPRALQNVGLHSRLCY